MIFATIDVFLAVVLIVLGYAMGRVRDEDDHDRLRALGWVLREETAPAMTPRELTKLQEELVAAGWVHSNHVKDPEHFDEFGRYLYWGD